ncbi:MAG: helix-turn-helix domain-containing protein [Candidatus Helarchaeota archaeon]
MGNDLKVITKKKNGTTNIMDTNGFINDLQFFDLSKEEAEIYTLLLRNKIMIAGDINKYLIDTGRTHVYNILSRLEKSGWIHVNRATKPQTYNPIPPAEILAEKLIEKRNVLLERLDEVNQFEEKSLPKLLRGLNSLHQQNSLKYIPIQYQSIITEYFENNPSVRIEYIHKPSNINPYLNFFFLTCVFHGFFISWHKKPISDEYSIHFYDFEHPISNTHLELAEKFLEVQGNEMIALLTEREEIEQIKPVEQKNIKINGMVIAEETISYKKGGRQYYALITHPWKLNKTTIAFFYANKRENGIKFLEWIIKRMK